MYIVIYVCMYIYIYTYMYIYIYHNNNNNNNNVVVPTGCRREAKASPPFRLEPLPISGRDFI